MITCYIDDREQNRIKPAYDYFTEAGYKTFVIELISGDYVFKDNETGITVAFEYKTIQDYIDSLTDYRVFNQAINQSNNFDYHYVLIVGTESETNKAMQDKKHYTGRYMTLKEFYGSFGSLLNVTSIIQVRNLNHALPLMESTARHCCSEQPVLKRFRKSRGTPALRLLANNVDRVGYKTAEKICRECDLETIDDVFALNTERLIEIDGIGEKTAYKILSQLKREFL